MLKIKNAVKSILNSALRNPSFFKLMNATVGRLGSYLKDFQSGHSGFGKENRFEQLYDEFSSSTRIPRDAFIQNLKLIEKFSHVPGSVVECGVWRGGMSAAIASVLGTNREYFLYDSFEGLPAVRPVDGESALEWQESNKIGRCATEMHYAEDSMKRAGIAGAHIVKGWFADTLPTFPKEGKIAVLRLDADWYSSTAECLNYLYAQVVEGGLIVIDDYMAWDGCSKATHDFLSANLLEDRIEYQAGIVCFIKKRRLARVTQIPIERA